MTTVSRYSNDTRFCDESLFASFVNWVFEEFRDEASSCSSSSDSLDSSSSSDSSDSTIITSSTYGARGKPYKSRKRALQKAAPVEPGPLKWNVFRTFEKSDALMHFPSTFARLTNSGEGILLGKLVKAYCSKSCVISLPKHSSISVSQFVDFLDFSDILFPDSMTFMHTTEILDNQIHALFYFKYTDTEDMHTHADAVVRDPFFKTIFVGARPTVLRDWLNLDSRAESAQRAIGTLVDLGSDLQIYGCLRWKITFDRTTKKFLHFEHFWSFTEVACDGVRFML